jgi:hypothetical protein
MRRFLLFVGSNYYPRGGWKDYRGGFHSIDAAVADVPTDQNRYEYSGGWYQVVDLHGAGGIVASGDVDNGALKPNQIVD